MSEENEVPVTEEVEVTEEVQEVQAETEVQAEAVAPVAAPVALNIQDLANIRKLLDIASQRGAYKTEEFQIVGAVYGKLSTFVDAALAAAEANKVESEVEAATKE